MLVRPVFTGFNGLTMLTGCHPPQEPLFFNMSERGSDVRKWQDSGSEGTHLIIKSSSTWHEGLEKYRPPAVKLGSQWTLQSLECHARGVPFCSPPGPNGGSHRATALTQGLFVSVCLFCPSTPSPLYSTHLALGFHFG
ncbi:hypothetical protein PAMP_005461 [Pampus punctatissimus]